MAKTKPDEEILAIHNLDAAVEGRIILSHINFCAHRGKTHVIMGPNGAGKSTLGHVIMGDPEYEITNGNIIFDGQDITELAPDKRSQAGIFLSFQAPVEIPGVPVLSFLRAMSNGRENLENMKGKQFRRHARDLAKMLDMDPTYLDRELGVGFSGGEKKKLEMLQLLLLQPKLAILDETDSGLDVDALDVVSRGIDAYRKGDDATLIIITHNTRILEHLDVDRVYILVRGRIVDEGDASLIDDIDSHGFERYERNLEDSPESSVDDADTSSDE